MSATTSPMRQPMPQNSRVIQRTNPRKRATPEVAFARRFARLRVFGAGFGGRWFRLGALE